MEAHGLLRDLSAGAAADATGDDNYLLGDDAEVRLAHARLVGTTASEVEGNQP